LRQAVSKTDFAPSRHVLAANANVIALEIDAIAFENENQARLRRGDRGYAPLDTVEWQYAGAVFSVGFLHKCQDCGHKAPRVEFNKGEAPPWRCPQCRSINVFRTMESERIELPEIIANHGYNTKRVYPNKMSADGQLLIEKDNSRPPIRLLKKVSRIDPKTGHQVASRAGFHCSFCGDEFLTPKLLQEHRAKVHGLGGGAVSEVPKVNPVTVIQPPPAPAPAPKPVAAPVQAPPPPEPETVSVAAETEEAPNDLAERRSPSEIRAMLRQAQKGKGAKAGGPQTE